MQIEAPQANNQSYEITTLVRYLYTFTITNKKPTLFQPQRMDEFFLNLQQYNHFYFILKIDGVML